jgi:hypothetical protein
MLAACGLYSHHDLPSFTIRGTPIAPLVGELKELLVERGIVRGALDAAFRGKHERWDEEDRRTGLRAIDPSIEVVSCKMIAEIIEKSEG